MTQRRNCMTGTKTIKLWEEIGIENDFLFGKIMHKASAPSGQ